jgi:hypothetical protein
MFLYQPNALRGGAVRAEIALLLFPHVFYHTSLPLSIPFLNFIFIFSENFPGKKFSEPFKNLLGKEGFCFAVDGLYSEIMIWDIPFFKFLKGHGGTSRKKFPHKSRRYTELSK